MSSRSILIAVLGLTLSGCAVYDYDYDDYDARYYGRGGYSVQRYEVYPSYPVYPRGYRYDYPRYDSYPQRYYGETGHRGRHDGWREQHDRHESRERYERHDGHDHPRPQPYGVGPAKQGWGARQPVRDQFQRQRAVRPVIGQPVAPQVWRGRENGQQWRQEQPRLRYGEPGGRSRHTN